MVISVSELMDLKRMGMLSSFRELSKINKIIKIAYTYNT